jgi:hypothetical protein
MINLKKYFNKLFYYHSISIVVKEYSINQYDIINVIVFIINELGRTTFIELSSILYDLQHIYKIPLNLHWFSTCGHPYCSDIHYFISVATAFGVINVNKHYKEYYYATHKKNKILESYKDFTDKYKEKITHYLKSPNIY